VGDIMLYYSNVKPFEKHIVFIGRFVIFHKGHSGLIVRTQREKKLPALILIRNTIDEIIEPINRAEIIKKWMIANSVKGSIMIIPDIEGVYYGRGVGYNIEEINLDEKTKAISATEIRTMIKEYKDSWKQYVDESIIDEIEKAFK